MSNLISLKAEDFGIEETRAKQIADQFKPMLTLMEELEVEYNEVIKLPVEEFMTSKRAKELRLRYVKVRTGTAAIHKQQKDFYLQAGRYIDGWKNAQLFASQGIEDKLESIEKYAENKEKERIAKVQAEREALLAPYGLQNLETLNLGAMNDDVWNNFLTGTKTTHDQKVQAEKKAEEAKKEKDERTQKLFDAGLKFNGESFVFENDFGLVDISHLDVLTYSKTKFETTVKDAIKNIALWKKAQSDKDEELRIKKEKDDKEEADRLAEEKKQKEQSDALAKAPVKKQLTAWIEAFELPSTQADHELVTEIKAKFESFKSWAKNQVNTL
jgi:hypothetical protein